MLTAKEEAIELVEKYWSYQWQVHKSTKSFKQIGMSKSAAKYCALICVDRIIQTCAFYDYKTKKNFENCRDYSDACFVTYWQEVKQELIKLK